MDEGGKFFYIESLKNKLKVQNFEHKYRRLVNFLVKMHENVQIANLMLDNHEISGLKEILNTLRNGNNTLIDTISGGRLKDEKLMEITLGTTEDINQTLSREEDKRNGYKPKEFTSYFLLNNVVPIKGNYKSRPRSEKKKRVERNREEYEDGYNKDRYKERIKGNNSNKVKNANDIFDLFSTDPAPTNTGFNQGNNNQNLEGFFANPNSTNNNNNFSQGRFNNQLQNNPIGINMNNNNNNDLFRSQIINPRMNFNNMNTNNNNNNNQKNNSNNMNNLFRSNQFQASVQQPIQKPMSNFEVLEQKLNALSLGEIPNQPNLNNQFNTQVFSSNINNMNAIANNSNSNNNRFDIFGPAPQLNSNSLVPYLSVQPFSNNNNNNTFGSNIYGQATNTQMPIRPNNLLNNNNANNINMANSQINLNNNNMGFTNNNTQMSYNEMEKQKKLKELDDLF